MSPIDIGAATCAESVVSGLRSRSWQRFLVPFCDVGGV
jgi:hypothetical protein